MYFFQRFIPDYLNPKKKYCINSKFVSTKFTERYKRTNFWSGIPSYGASFMLPNSETEPFFSEKQRNWFQKIVTQLLRLIWPQAHKNDVKSDYISPEYVAIRFIWIPALIYQLVFGWTVREEFEIGFKGISISSLQYTPEISNENKHQLWDIIWELKKQSWIFYYEIFYYDLFQAEIFKAEFWALIGSIK